MSELIERQAAIDAINSWRGRFSEEYNEAIDDCENSIIELPTIQPEQQWIPVKREVPEMPGYYITSSEYGGVTVDFYYDHFWNARKNAYKVLAWMPLPKIYKPNK